MLRVEFGLPLSRFGCDRLIPRACLSPAFRGVGRADAGSSRGSDQVEVGRDPGAKVNSCASTCADHLTTSPARHVVGCVTSWSKEAIPAFGWRFEDAMGRVVVGGEGNHVRRRSS